MIEIPYIYKQMKAEQLMRINAEYSDSIRAAKLYDCMNYAETANYNIINLQKNLEKSQKKNKRLRTIAIGGCTVSAGCLLLLLMTQ